MLKTLALIWPILFPSWRFFKTIEPSPRIEWTKVSGGAPEWRALRLRPQSVSPGRLVLGLLWNPIRNQDLFLVSCAERIADTPTPHSIDEIARYVRAAAAASPAQMLQFRLVFVHRDGDDLVRDEVFVSDPFAQGGPP